MEPDIWRWANAQGKPISITLSDLRSALSRNAIPAQALVWKKGWRHWLPAYRVEELKTALGSLAREPQTPVFDPKQTEPPKLPPRPATEIEPPRHSTPVPPPPRGQVLARRPAAPTVTNELPPTMPTLRPPGAVPPPPRSIPRSMLQELEDWDPSAPHELQTALYGATSSKFPVPKDVESPTSSIPNPSKGRNLTNGAKNQSSAAIDFPESEVSAPAHAAPESGTIPYDPDAVPGRGDMPIAPNQTGTASLFPFRRNRAIVRLALTVGALSLAAGTWLLFKPNRQTLPLPTPVIDSRSLSQKPLSCQISRTAERVSPRVFMSVTPITLESSFRKRVAVGFAESATTAAGITVDPLDLSVQFPYREVQDKKILSVVPQILKDSLSFVTVREGIQLSQARALTLEHQFIFGVMTAGLSRMLAGQSPETVWPLDAKTVITDPRIVSISGLGHAVTYREGGQNGEIKLGLLTTTGQSLSTPTTVPSPVSILGTPTIAASTTSTHHPQLLLTFAGRNTETEFWSIYLSIVAWDKPPKTAHVFSLPDGGPGADAISPSATAFLDGHWLLQWSEGPTGQRQIRVQLLDGNLRPVGKAHTVSPANTNSGQGLLWVDGNRAVSFFVVSTGKQTELWASSLVCSK